MRLRIICVGKTKNLPIKSLSAEYRTRIRHLTAFEFQEVRDLSKARGYSGASLLAAEGAEIAKCLPEGGRIVVLDEKGKQFSSTELARWLEAEQNRGTREVSFIIGGPDGMSAEISRRAHLKLSLGKMTWTHEMCRVLLLEQIYRALTILRNFPYHK